MFAVRMTLPPNVISQTFAPSKWVTPPTVSSTSPSVTMIRFFPERYARPEGSGLGLSHAAVSTVCTSDELNELAAGATAAVSESSTIWPRAWRDPPLSAM
jgi:hypothetical protein